MGHVKNLLFCSGGVCAKYRSFAFFINLVNAWNVFFAEVSIFIFLPIAVVGGITPAAAAPSPIIMVDQYSWDFPRPIGDTEHLYNEINFLPASFLTSFLSS